jgi:dTDP-4-amino-4,6-dideoxygalactose transaminase
LQAQNFSEDREKPRAAAVSREIHNQRCFQLALHATPAPWSNSRHALYASGREALTALIDALAWKRGEAVLLPGFVPEGLVAPFRGRGLAVELYPLDANLDPDWPALAQLLAAHRPKLAVLIHYFGMHKPIDRFTDLAHRHGALVLEDLAHVIPTPGDGLGTTGDLVLYSLPKLLGVPDGSPLVVLSPQLKLQALTFSPHRLHQVYLVQQMCSIAVNTLSRHLPGGSFWRMLRGVTYRSLDSYGTLMRYFDSPNRMSLISRLITAHTDFEGHARRRQEFAARYESGLDRRAFRRFEYAGAGGLSGIGFPVLVDDRASLVRHLSAHLIQGVFFENRWDFVAPADRAKHQRSIDIMKKHFLFPMFPGLSAAEIDRVIEVANRWAATAPG